MARRAGFSWWVCCRTAMKQQRWPAPTNSPATGSSRCPKAPRRGPHRDPPLLRRPRQHRPDRPEPLRPPRRLRQRPGAPLAPLSRTRLRPLPLRRRNLTGPYRSRRLPRAAQALPAVRHAPGRRIRPRGTAPGDPRSPPSRHRASRRPPGRHSHRLRPRPPNPRIRGRAHPPLFPPGRCAETPADLTSQSGSSAREFGATNPHLDYRYTDSKPFHSPAMDVRGGIA